MKLKLVVLIIKVIYFLIYSGWSAIGEQVIVNLWEETSAFMWFIHVRVSAVPMNNLIKWTRSY